MAEKGVRHIVNVSGGKDSAALAIYLKDRIPNLEYVFCDTEKELPETYEYLSLLESVLGQPIVRLKHEGGGFDHWWKLYGGYLPSAQARWCTRHLKIEPFERYAGSGLVRSYIGIRADEDRPGYDPSSTRNIIPVYPFVDDGIGWTDVRRILLESGIGLPKYYEWRSRSGCFFCFFQQKIEWIGLLEHHADLFTRAKDYEKTYPTDGVSYTWSDGESLEELSRPERIAQVKAEHERRMQAERRRRKKNSTLMEVFSDDDVFCSVLEGYETQKACLWCR